MKHLLRPLSIACGALATTALGACYYGDVNGADYAYSDQDCSVRYGNDYYDQAPLAYDDGYDCYDMADYNSGFAQIGFGGGWYDNYFYPGYGRFLFDRYDNRYPLRGQYLTYWGGRRAWWRHHRQDGAGGRPDGHHWQGGNRPGGSRGEGQHGGRHNGQQGDRPDGNGHAGVPSRGHQGRDHPGAGNPNPGRPHNGPGVSQPGRGPGAVRPAPPSVARPAPPPPPAARSARPAPTPSARQNRREYERVRPD